MRFILALMMICALTSCALVSGMKNDKDTSAHHRSSHTTAPSTAPTNTNAATVNAHKMIKPLT